MSLRARGRAAEPDGSVARPCVADAAEQLATAVAASDWKTVGEIVTDHWPELVFGGHSEIVRQAIGRFPAASLRQVPTLGFYREMTGSVPPGSFDLSLPESDEQLRRLGRSSRAGPALRLTAVAIAARRSQGRHVDALDLVRRGRVIAQAAEWSVLTDVDHLVALWYAQAGLAAQLAGDFALARHLHRSAHRRRERTSFDFVAADSAGNLALLDALEGNLTEAQWWAARAAAETYSTSWVSRFVPTPRHVARAVVATDRLDLEALDRALEALSGTDDLDEHWPNVVWAQAHAGLLFSDPVGLTDSIRSSVEAHGHRIGPASWARDVLAITQAQLALKAGRPHRAKMALDPLGDQPHVMAVRARLSLLTGDARRAGELLSMMSTGSPVSPRTRAESWLLMAEVLHVCGDLDAAADALRQALRITEPHASVAIYATAPRRVLEHHEPRVERLGDVLRALDAAKAGEVYENCGPLVELTPRETVVLDHLATGATINEIARQLFVSPNTIKTQCRTLSRKLGATTRADAVLVARRIGLLD